MEIHRYRLSKGRRGHIAAVNAMTTVSNPARAESDCNLAA